MLALRPKPTFESLCRGGIPETHLPLRRHRGVVGARAGWGKGLDIGAPDASLTPRGIREEPVCCRRQHIDLQLPRDSLEVPHETDQTRARGQPRRAGFVRRIYKCCNSNVTIQLNTIRIGDKEIGPIRHYLRIGPISIATIQTSQSLHP